MAYEIVKTKSILAGADLSSAQFTFVKIDTSGKINTPTNGGDACGVLQDKPKSGDPGAVCYPGDITKVAVGAAVAAGAYVQTDGTGKAVTCVSGSRILGVALSAGTNSGDIIDIIYQPGATKL